MWYDVLKLVGGLVVLLIGGEFLVRGASNMAYSFQITPLVVGLTIVAFGTSAPELLISVQSALEEDIVLKSKGFIESLGFSQKRTKCN